VVANPSHQPLLDPIAGDFWITTSGDDLTLRPALARDETVDIAILGGGFSGLWAAYYLLTAQPDLKVAIVERNFCGYGASGRNGGWCSPRFPLDAGALIKRFGVETARRTIGAQLEIVAEIGRICAHEGIDAHYRNTGLLSLARSEHQFHSLVGTLKTYQDLGLGDGNRLLSAGEAFDRVHATHVHGALEARAGANVHPGRLVRGLARTVERLGATIYESTEALKIDGGQNPTIVTDGGVITARKAVILAGEGYLTELPKYRRQLLPMSSMIALTAPLTPEQWKIVGWDRGESLSSQVHTKNYLTRTQDGRILFGSRGAPYLFGSRMSEGALREDAIYEWMRGCVLEWWPDLEGIAFTNAWGGYLGVPRDWLPTVHFDEASRIGHLYGYTGRGVSTSAMCAKLLAGLIGKQTSGLEGLPFHRTRAQSWEPEPFRWAGVRYIQSAFARIDEAESADKPRPIDAGFAEYLGEP